MSRESAGERGRSLLRPMISTRIRVSSLRLASLIRWRMRLGGEGGGGGGGGREEIKPQLDFMTERKPPYVQSTTNLHTVSLNPGKKKFSLIINECNLR